MWNWPAAVDANAALLQLRKERAKIHLEAGVFKCHASEGRTLLPVLAHFVRKGIAKSTNATEREHGLCFLSLAKFVEELEADARGNGDASRARAAASAYLLSYKRLAAQEQTDEALAFFSTNHDYIYM